MGVQVQTATKYINGEGKLTSLSPINKQFISFNYGGKDIEDFGFVVVFNGDRLSKNLYANFKDVITEQSELDGQLFWSSNYGSNELSFNLATDGVTSKQLEEFKNWFIPGVERELILSEHHNRWIRARVSNPPQMSLLPFEDVNLGKKTSLYKGELTLNFVMDEPFWNVKEPYFDKEEGEETEEEIKIKHEDGIPFLTDLTTSLFLPNGNYYIYSDDEKTGSLQISIVGTDISQDKLAYLYYCGTAPSRPSLHFKINIGLNSEGRAAYISKVNNEDNSSEYQEQAFIQLNNNKFIFGLPNIISTYNHALDIIELYGDTDTIDLKKRFRESLVHYTTRAKIIECLDTFDSEETGKDNFIDYLKQKAETFLPKTIELVINSETGRIVIVEEKNEAGDITKSENAGDIARSKYLIIEERNMPNSNGQITATECLPITTNCILNDFKIIYNLKYL